MEHIQKPEQRVQAEIGTHPLLTEIIRWEPDVRTILLVAALQRPERNRWHAYSALKKMVTPLVGFYARKPELQSSEHYLAAIEAIHHLLPETPRETDARRDEWVIEAWECSHEVN